MNQLLDKILILACSIILYIQTFNSNYVILPILVALLFSCFSIYCNHIVVQVILYFAYLIMCIFFAPLTLFLPLIMYDLALTKFQYCLFFIFYLTNRNITALNRNTIALTILFCVFSYYLKYKSKKHKHLQELYEKMSSDGKELVQLQEEKNRSILENQDYEVSIATLNERNRISKEIHDHIGHVLSRALLQIGALLTITKEPMIKEELILLKESLSEGMNDIRASVHNMHDESIDLYNSIQKLVMEFHFCEIQFDYDIMNPPLLKIKYCLIAIIKEALSNIIKHSNATKVTVLLVEEPALYRLIIEDNGSISEKTKAVARRVQLSNDYVEGMGLQNMIERVKGFEGTLGITANDGFKIFIAIPKENNGGC